MGEYEGDPYDGDPGAYDGEGSPENGDLAGENPPAGLNPPAGEKEAAAGVIAPHPPP